LGGQDEEQRDQKIRIARLKWYGHVIRRDEGEPVRDIME
jgi:hypothetical protein